MMLGSKYFSVLKERENGVVCVLSCRSSSLHIKALPKIFSISGCSCEKGKGVTNAKVRVHMREKIGAVFRHFGRELERANSATKSKQGKRGGGGF